MFSVLYVLSNKILLYGILPYKHRLTIKEYIIRRSSPDIFINYMGLIIISISVVSMCIMYMYCMSACLYVSVRSLKKLYTLTIP